MLIPRSVASDLCLHCLHRPVSQHTQAMYGILKHLCLIKSDKFFEHLIRLVKLCLQIYALSYIKDTVHCIAPDNSWYPDNICFSFSLQKRMFCYSLEASSKTHRGASNEYPQHIFLWRNKNIGSFHLKKKCVLTGAMLLVGFVGPQFSCLSKMRCNTIKRPLSHTWAIKA